MALYKEDVTPEVEALYWKVYFATLDTMYEAQGRLLSLENAATDIGDRSMYRSERLKVEANIELLRAKRLAFSSGSQPIEPPTQATVDAVSELLKKVSGMTADRKTASVILDTATQAMNMFNQVQTLG